METRPFTLDLKPWDPIIENPNKPGTALAALRAEQNLSRPDVARSMGYRNLSKGCNRLTQWESEQRRPNKRQCAALDAAYNLPSGSIQALWKETDLVEAERYRQRQRIIEHDANLLDRYYQTLMDHRVSILLRPDWRNIRVEAARVSLIWAGGGLLSIGELLEGWASGDLIHPTLCGRGVPLISANGSALSGLRSTRVLRREGVKLDRHPSPLTVLRGFRFPRPPHTPWNLSQLLDALNAPVPDLVIRDESGAVIGRYEYGRRTLFNINGRRIGGLKDATSTYPTPASEFCGITVGGQTSTLPVGGLSGGWKRHRFILTDGWEYQEGRMIHHGQVRARLDGSPPPSLLPHLIRLTQKPEY